MTPKQREQANWYYVNKGVVYSKSCFHGDSGFLALLSYLALLGMINILFETGFRPVINFALESLFLFWAGLFFLLLRAK